MRAAITGGRHFKDESLVMHIIDMLLDNHTIMVGDCPTGVDHYVQKHFDCIIFKADWESYGLAAGPIRNGELIEHADILIAFPGGKGTEDCVRQAKKRGVAVLRVETT